MVSLSRISLIILLLIALAMPVYALEYGFDFTSVESHKQISDAVVYFYFDNYVTNKYIYENDYVVLSIEDDENLFIIVDDINTSGVDYYASVSLIELDSVDIVDANTVLLKPASSLRGVVKDELDNIVSNAKLKFECADSSLVLPESTDEFGSFFVEGLSAGECKVFASYGDYVGFSLVDLKKGDIADVEVKLDNSIVYEQERESGSYLILLIFFLLFVFGIVIYFVFRNYSLFKKVKEKESDKLGSVLKTLNRKESKIVNLLKGRENYTELQSKIRHELGIPRTTLSRLLISLEKKKIITVFRSFRIVKVKLNDWIVK